MKPLPLILAFYHLCFALLLTTMAAILGATYLDVPLDDTLGFLPPISLSHSYLITGTFALSLLGVAHFLGVGALLGRQAWAKTLLSFLAILNIFISPVGFLIAIGTYFLFFGKNAAVHLNLPTRDSDVIPDSGKKMGCGCMVFVVAALILSAALFWLPASIKTAPGSLDRSFSDVVKDFFSGFSQEATTGAPVPQEDAPLKEAAPERVLEELTIEKGVPKNIENEKGTWRFVDHDGVIHIVDHFLNVPAAYREKAEKITF